MKVQHDPATFDLDLRAIEAAITPRTRVVIINTPCNPTGKIYPPATLAELALLEETSRRNGRTIYILADEPYSRIVFDGQPFYSPTAYYPNTLLAYSYGKVLLAPGQRIGFLALPPTMPEREQVRQNIFVMQGACGHMFPNALLQHALADLDHFRLTSPISSASAIGWWRRCAAWATRCMCPRARSTCCPNRPGPMMSPSPTCSLNMTFWCCLARSPRFRLLPALADGQRRDD